MRTGKAAERLAEAEARVQALPDRDVTKQHAEMLKLYLRREVQSRDWRELSHDEIKRYLIFLFSENPKKAGLGIFVTREHGEWVLKARGRFDVPQQRMADGSWYLYPHDEALKSAEDKIRNTKSWDERGGYSFPHLPRWLATLLAPYRIGEV